MQAILQCMGDAVISLIRGCRDWQPLFFLQEKPIPDKMRYISGQNSSSMKARKYSGKRTDSTVHEPALAYEKAHQVAVHRLLELEHLRVNEPLNRVETFRKGLRKKSFEKLKEVTGLDNETLATALAVSSKTIQRTDVFDTVQSEKMYALAELYAMGIEYFGQEGFRRWMERPLFSIGNIRPLALIDVSEGITILKTEIMRLQHGIAI
jgi:putative toxin-antitoxin system antitoxin component (TIGR02293 family)